METIVIVLGICIISNSISVIILNNKIKKLEEKENIKKGWL